MRFIVWWLLDKQVNVTCDMLRGNVSWWILFSFDVSNLTGISGNCSPKRTNSVCFIFQKNEIRWLATRSAKQENVAFKMSNVWVILGYNLLCIHSRDGEICHPRDKRFSNLLGFLQRLNACWEWVAFMACNLRQDVCSRLGNLCLVFKGGISRFALLFGGIWDDD